MVYFKSSYFIILYIYIYPRHSPSEFPLGNGVAWATKKGSFSTFFFEIKFHFLEKSDFELFFGRFFGSNWFSLPAHFIESASGKNATTFFK